MSDKKMSVFKQSDWIWINDNDESDEYGEFYTEFDIKQGRNTILRISCDGDYTLYINGKFAASNQYGDFEHYKIYDEIDITELVHEGNNTLSVLVWHFGDDSSRYKKAKAGLIFEICSCGQIISTSCTDTKSRKSAAYESGRCKKITAQLGFGFHYDASREDCALFTGEGFCRSVIVSKKTVFHKRIGEKLRLGYAKLANITEKNDGRYYLIDLGEETVGILTLKLTSESAQKIRIDWGEDLQNGHVRRIIDQRTFSVEYTTKPGKNEYTNYMLRFGARYLELWCDEPIQLEYATLIPQYYPVTVKNAILEDPLDQKIYDMCVNTLRLSMMEHYVDCPWREQALYAFDSRNQMLSGYYAFDGGNTEYAYSNLKLINQDKRYNDLLSICYPSGKELAIPSFSLHYFTEVLEHYEHSKNKVFLEEAYPKLISIAKAFSDNMKNGLVYTFAGKDHWNFYDWSEHLDGSKNRGGDGECDSIINLLYLLSLDKLKKISEIIGKDFCYNSVASEIRANIREAFFDNDAGLFSFRKREKDYTELANSLAILAECVNTSEAECICQKIISGKVTESSLSLKCFMYDALLKTNEKYKEYILNEIRKNYGYMLSQGATTAWETIKGAADFGNAGSLCHGWSAIPVYYYHKLNMVK